MVEIFRCSGKPSARTRNEAEWIFYTWLIVLYILDVNQKLMPERRMKLNGYFVTGYDSIHGGDYSDALGSQVPERGMKLNGYFIPGSSFSIYWMLIRNSCQNEE
ncbi:hypothetical protein HNY73_001375 [Argiope bruennichi]|uniref:Uncharacterized protein n=1 Tax=Argiope bruennichi TaxID=94029 RepID=A0A8T0G3H6_ARGBR|nr:hypothetical protein HNY73_001375 [Argiope bruennichi]